MKSYPVKMYTSSEYDALDGNVSENTIYVVWTKKAICMDIMATGTRIVPILRKIETAMRAAGLSGDGAIYDGWFGAWADSLTDPTEKPHFIWKYDGKSDLEQGHWSYSWSIEQIDNGLWYVFLNIARPEESTLPA